MSELSSEKQAHVEQRLRSDNIIWLGTVRADGRPHLVAVWFLWDGERIVILSQPKTQKIRNLSQNPQVILALDNTREGEDVITIDGHAVLTTVALDDAHRSAYLEKYGAQIVELGMTLESMAADYAQVITITPRRFRN